MNLVEGSDKVERIFACWPEFHDAEVLSITLDRAPVDSGPTVRLAVHAFESTKDVDAKGLYVLGNHVVVTFVLLVVEFLPGTPDVWAGNFAPGVGGYTGVHDHPNGRDLIVFAVGSARVIDPTKRELVAELPGSDCIFGVYAVTDPPGFVCDIQGLEFFRLGPEGIIWHTRRLSLDGFRDVVLTDTRIMGAGMGSDARTWTPFEVDLRTGEAKGGLYMRLL